MMMIEFFWVELSLTTPKCPWRLYERVCSLLTLNAYRATLSIDFKFNCWLCQLVHINNVNFLASLAAQSLQFVDLITIRKRFVFLLTPPEWNGVANIFAKREICPVQWIHQLACHEKRWISSRSLCMIKFRGNFVANKIWISWRVSRKIFSFVSCVSERPSCEDATLPDRRPSTLTPSNLALRKSIRLRIDFQLKTEKCSWTRC